MEPWEYLKEYVGQTNTEYDSFIQSCWDEATALVDRYIGASEVPDHIYTRAIKETGANLFQRRKAGNNQSDGYVAPGVTPVFAAKDPMTAVYPMLRPWVGWF